MSEKTRKLAAIMFTDIVGYSRIMSADERHGLKLLNQHDAILMPIIEKRNGKVLKKMGDAVFAEFNSSVNAVECAIEIQTVLKEFNQEKELNDKIIIRIGIHMGDVVVHGDDLFGEGINVAARLEPLAEPGGVCMSQVVYQSVRAQMDINAIKVGEVELKNILEKHIIYKIPRFYAKGLTVKEGSAPQATSKSLRDFKIKSIQNLPSPSRSAWGVGLTSFFILLFFIVTVMTVGTIVGYSKVKYTISKRDFLDPAGVIAKLKDVEDIHSSQIRAQIQRKTIRLIEEYDSSKSKSDSSSLTDSFINAVRKDLNRLIKSERLIFDEEGLEKLNLSIKIKDMIAKNPRDQELSSINRKLLEQVFHDEIEVFDDKQLRLELFYKALTSLWSERKIIFFLYVIFILLYAFIFTFLAVYTLSLKTIRIFLFDVRAVDKILEYFVEQIGFKPPIKDGNNLIFKAKLMTTIMWNVFKIRARIDGNMIILTGPLGMVRKFRKQIQSFSAQD